MFTASYEVKQSQIPSHAIIKKSHYSLNGTDFISGTQVTAYSSLGFPANFLYSRSPRDLLRLSTPLTRSSSTNIPAYSILNCSVGNEGL